ncbi:MAG: sigma-70 family RNA polymerase sigma factor [Pseudomonadota bacterium]
MRATEEESDDARLVARVAQGDMIAMKTLYQRHSEAVLRFVRSRLRDQFEASDVVHNTMLDVWRGAGRFEGRSSVRSWILSIARYKTVDHVRKQSRVELGEADEEIPDDSPNPEAVLAVAQDAARVRACVEELPAHQRSAVHLAFFEEMTYGEIAAVSDVPEGTIKTRIYHAKKLLMRCLSR